MLLSGYGVVSSIQFVYMLKLHLRVCFCVVLHILLIAVQYTDSLVHSQFSLRDVRTKVHMYRRLCVFTCIGDFACSHVSVAVLLERDMHIVVSRLIRK